tara:strand:- start:48 stop:386 length:339 start_codon:yes stop_codon:yes gene_type:complete
LEFSKINLSKLFYFINQTFYNYKTRINIMIKNKSKAYWKDNIRYLFILLTVWFLVSFGAGIIFKNFLNEFKFGGFKIGFWFAQQGSMYVFVILIFIYVRLMNKLDKKYGYDK